MKPTREHATNTGHTYMITSATWGRRDLLRRDCSAQLFIDTLYHYRGSAYLLHEFVVVPDHVHVLLTPLTSLEKAVQFIKGGSSYRAKKDLGSNMEVWQKGFSDHRIRDAEDYLRHVSYVRENPVRKHFCEKAEEFPYSSAHVGFELDPVPQGRKPGFAVGPSVAPEGATFQNRSSDVAPLQGAPPGGVSDSTPFQSEPFAEAAHAAPLQGRAAASDKTTTLTKDQTKIA